MMNEPFLEEMFSRGDMRPPSLEEIRARCNSVEYLDALHPGVFGAVGGAAVKPKSDYSIKAWSAGDNNTTTNTNNNNSNGNPVLQVQPTESPNLVPDKVHVSMDTSSLFSYVPVDVDVSSQGTHSVFDDALSEATAESDPTDLSHQFSEGMDEKFFLGTDFFSTDDPAVDAKPKTGSKNNNSGSNINSVSGNVAVGTAHHNHNHNHNHNHFDGGAASMLVAPALALPPSSPTPSLPASLSPTSMRSPNMTRRRSDPDKKQRSQMVKVSVGKQSNTPRKQAQNNSGSSNKGRRHNNNNSNNNNSHQQHHRAQPHLPHHAHHHNHHHHAHLHAQQQHGGPRPYRTTTTTTTTISAPQHFFGGPGGAPAPFPPSVYPNTQQPYLGQQQQHHHQQHGPMPPYPPHAGAPFDPHPHQHYPHHAHLHQAQQADPYARAPSPQPFYGFPQH